MNCAESSHANGPKPSPEISPPLPAAGSAEPFRNNISTKLPDRRDDFPASLSSPLRWIQTKVLTPVRESMRRVNVTPMMTTLSGVRRTLINDLSADQASKSTSSSSSSPDPNLLSNDLSQRALSPPEECPPNNASAMSLSGACTKIKQADCPVKHTGWQRGLGPRKPKEAVRAMAGRRGPCLIQVYSYLSNNTRTKRRVMVPVQATKFAPYLYSSTNSGRPPTVVRLINNWSGFHMGSS